VSRRHGARPSCFETLRIAAKLRCAAPQHEGGSYALAFAVAMNARPADEGGAYFAGLGFELRSGAPPGLNPKLPSSSSAA
jgi:hypothetical protein